MFSWRSSGVTTTLMSSGPRRRSFRFPPSTSGRRRRVKLRALWVGKTQEEWLRRGIDEYAGRIRRYCPLELAEAREEKGAAAEAMREREGERLIKLLPRNARLILLDERGEQLTSPELGAFIASNRDGG